MTILVDCQERLDLLREVIERAVDRLACGAPGENDEDTRSVVSARLRAVRACLDDVIELLG